MTDFEIEENGVDCVDEEFDEASREWKDERPDGSTRRNIRFDENGNIIVRNPSAYWIPELTVTEEIDGTIYTVSGTYEGSEGLDKKLARIMLHNLEDF